MAATSTQSPCPICAAAGTPSDAFPGTGLLHCQACDFAFLDWKEEEELYGDDYFEAYVGGGYLAQEAQRRHESRLRLDLLEEVAPPPARVLEVGAAAGFFLDEARSRGYEGAGIEPNGAMAAHARKQLGLDVRTGRLGEAALPEAGGPEAGFDAVCAFHVVEHLPDPLGSLEAVFQALRPGGHVVIEVPNAQSAAAHKMGARWKPLDLPHHLGHHGPRSLRELLRRAGLEPLSIDTVPFAYYARAARPARFVRGALEGMRSGAPRSVKPHPSDHQLLRAIGRRPAA